MSKEQHEWYIKWSNDKRKDIKGTIDSVKAYADKHSFPSHEDIVIFDYDSDAGSTRQWYFGKFDSRKYHFIDPIEFGKEGFFGDWIDSKMM